MTFYLILALVVFLVGAFLIQGLVQIQAEPPHKGLVTFLGKRKEKIADEGWHFLPLYPWVYGAIFINVTKVNQDLPEEIVRTPDNAELGLKISLTWSPDKDSPQSLINFLDSGGREGVKSILHDVAVHRLRKWCYSKEDNSPQTWEDLYQIPDEMVKVLLKAISDKLEWENIEEEEVDKVRSGNGQTKVPSLGIVIHRINIASPELKGELAKAAELEAKEARDRSAEIAELIHVAEQMAALTSEPNSLSREQAIEIIQTERGKVVKNIGETKISISPETRGLIEDLIPLLRARFPRNLRSDDE